MFIPIKLSGSVLLYNDKSLYECFYCQVHIKNLHMTKYKGHFPQTQPMQIILLSS